MEYKNVTKPERTNQTEYSPTFGNTVGKEAPQLNFLSLLRWVQTGNVTL